MENQSFILKAADGHVVASNLIFRADGTVEGFDDENSIEWEIELETLSLYFKFVKSRSLFARFNKVIEFSARNKFRVGKFYFDGKKPTLATLAPELETARKKFRRCHVVTSLQGRSKTLLVTFNGTGNFAGLRDTKWEFYNLPFIADLDYVHFSESRPSHWYLDQTRSIISILRGCISTGYEKVILCGMSSGGYASIYFAEALAREFRNIDFKSYSINPQTIHSLEARNEVLQRFPDNMRPIVITNAELKNRDCDSTELNEIISESDAGNICNAQHSIFFDSQNECDTFYSSFLAEFSRVKMYPKALGLSHGDGCASIFHMDMIQKEIIRESNLT